MPKCIQYHPLERRKNQWFDSIWFDCISIQLSHSILPGCILIRWETFERLSDMYLCTSIDKRVCANKLIARNTHMHGECINIYICTLSRFLCFDLFIWFITHYIRFEHSHTHIHSRLFCLLVDMCAIAIMLPFLSSNKLYLFYFKNKLHRI